MNDQHHVFDTSVQYRSLLHSPSECDYTLRRERPYAQAGAFFFCHSTRYATYPGLLLLVLLFTSRPPPDILELRTTKDLFCSAANNMFTASL